MFTRIDISNDIVQVKFGHDDLNTYKIGDHLPRKINKDIALCGDFLDGVYDGVSELGSHKEYWVTVSGGKIVDICEMIKDEYQKDYLINKFNAYESSETWSDHAWANLAKSNFNNFKENTKYYAKCFGKSKDEIMSFTFSNFIKDKLSEDSFSRKIMGLT